MNAVHFPIRVGAAAAALLTLAACAGPYRDGGPYPRPDYRTHPPAGAAHVTPPPRACPPGLAKKGSCIPPGQRKHWQRGDVVPDTVRVRVLTRYRDRGYRAPPRGQVYIEIDGGIYLMAQATRRIVRVMLAAN